MEHCPNCKEAGANSQAPVYNMPGHKFCLGCYTIYKTK